MEIAVRLKPEELAALHKFVMNQFIPYDERALHDAIQEIDAAHMDYKFYLQDKDKLSNENK
jgi:hypothetical protein